jgi:hypothetical protein
MMLAVRSAAVYGSVAVLAAWGVATIAQALALPPDATAAPAATMSLTALKQLEPGLWQLEVKGRSPRLTCVAEPTALVQIEHDQPNCSRFVIANEPKIATVHYSCQRSGWGRTTVRVETSGAALIQTQGISRNQPFDYSVHAKRVGACVAQAVPKPR